MMEVNQVKSKSFTTGKIPSFSVESGCDFMRPHIRVFSKRWWHVEDAKKYSDMAFALLCPTCAEAAKVVMLDALRAAQALGTSKRIPICGGVSLLEVPLEYYSLCPTCEPKMQEGYRLVGEQNGG